MLSTLPLQRFALTEMASQYPPLAHSHAQNDVFGVATNVASFPNQRATLVVKLICCQEDGGQSQIRSLFHSVLGVYVSDSRIERGEILVEFDIAVDDIDFTLHTLIRELPEAVIGPLQRKTFPQKYEVATSHRILSVVR
jgi:flagella basal body P-ring formation protein FlgA